MCGGVEWGHIGYLRTPGRRPYFPSVRDESVEEVPCAHGGGGYSSGTASPRISTPSSRISIGVELAHEVGQSQHRLHRALRVGTHRHPLAVP